MLGGSFPLFRVGPTLLQVHVTFPLLLAFVAFDGWSRGGSAGAAASVIFILLLFVCVILHEFGHVAAASRYGIRTPTVTLTPIGGIAALERMPEKPGQEIVVALAGPAVTLLIALVLYAVLGYALDFSRLTDTEADLAHLAARVALANVGLLIFNLIPAFPMDGGRVLRGLLAYRLGPARATQVAARIGQAFAIVFAVLAFFYDPMLLLVAAFVFLAAEAELRFSKRATRTGVPTAGEVRLDNLRVLSADDTVEDIFAAVQRSVQPAFPVADKEQRIVGTVTRTKLAEVWTSGARGAPIASILTPGMPIVKAGARLSDLHATFTASGAALAGIVDDGGRLVGFLSKEQILGMSPDRRDERPTGPLIRS
jgi:Zn-dependent protease/predicted transcriptional regulator